MCTRLIASQPSYRVLIHETSYQPLPRHHPGDAFNTNFLGGFMPTQLSKTFKSPLREIDKPDSATDLHFTCVNGLDLIDGA